MMQTCAVPVEIRRFTRRQCVAESRWQAVPPAPLSYVVADFSVRVGAACASKSDELAQECQAEAKLVAGELGVYPTEMVLARTLWSQS